MTINKNSFLKKMIIVAVTLLLLGTTIIPSTVSISSTNDDVENYIDPANKISVKWSNIEEIVDLVQKILETETVASQKPKSEIITETREYSSFFSKIFDCFSRTARVEGAYTLMKEQLPILKDIKQFMRNQIKDIKILASSTIVVPDDYPTIQEAINNANFGDTIQVLEGTYNENIVVDKMVNIIGSGSATTIIDGGQNDDVIETTSDGVLISDFTIKKSSPTGSGIQLSSHYNTIQNNNITENFYGIKLYPSTGNIIYGNNITNNEKDGLWLKHSHENTIENNSMIDNDNDGVSANMSSLSNHVNYNIIQKNEGDGMNIAETSFGSSLSYNRISGNTVGFKTTGSSDNNQFFKNAIVSNDMNAFDNANNTWDNGYPSGGNYWSDHIFEDNFEGPNQDIPSIDGDGICDTPYIIPGGDNQDPYPLMEPPSAAGGLPPITPKRPECLDCPGKLEPGKAYTFHFETSDPRYDKVIYHIDWDGDKLADQEVDCNPAMGIDVSHTFFKENSMIPIRVKAENDDGLQSGWSVSLPISTPKDKVGHDLLLDFLENHPRIRNWLERLYESYNFFSFFFENDFSNSVLNENTGKSYKSIQEAIDDSDTLDGHVINVQNGIYKENVQIYKELTLQGENREETIIDGQGEPAIKINVSNVTVTGFNITNGSNGVYILTDGSLGYKNDYENITSEVTIQDCNLYYNTRAIKILDSNNDSILNNKIVALNQFHNEGIVIWNSTNNVITDNSFQWCNILLIGKNKEEYYHEISENMVNGKPLCYYKKHDGAINPPDNCGSLLLVDCSNWSLSKSNINDEDIKNVNIGILISHCKDFSIKEINIEDNTFGINGMNCSNGLIQSTFSDNTVGLYFEDSSNLLIKGCSVYSNDIGILCKQAKDSIIEGNNINSDDGIQFNQCVNMTISDNHFSKCGVFLDGDKPIHFTHNIPMNNTINRNDKFLFYANNKEWVNIPDNTGCAIIANSNKIICEDISLNNVDICIEFAFSKDFLIYNSQFFSSDTGLYFKNCMTSESDYMRIENNNIEKNLESGITFEKCESFEFEEKNFIFDNYEYGVHIIDSTDCSFSKCDLSNNKKAGFYLDNATDNRILSNDMSGNIQGLYSKKSSQNLIGNNYFLQNTEGAIEMFLSDNNSITGNNIIGIGKYGRNELIEKELQNDTINKGNRGIFVDFSNDNYIQGNRIETIYGSGVHVAHSCRNDIHGNTFSLNRLYGIRLEETAIQNRIFNNAFMKNYWYSMFENTSQNTSQAFDDGIDNFWNLSYYGDPSHKCGNYWNGHTKPDHYCGPGQNETGNADGIVDKGLQNDGGLNPYFIDGKSNSKDWYPLVEPSDKCPISPELDDEAPELEFIFPSSLKNGFYMWGDKKLDFPINLCIGDMEILVHANDNEGGSGSLKVEFYLIPYFEIGWNSHDNFLMKTDTEPPYTWNAWGMTSCGLYKLSAKAIDRAGNTAEESIDLFIICMNKPWKKYV